MVVLRRKEMEVVVVVVGVGVVNGDRERWPELGVFSSAMVAG